MSTHDYIIDNAAPATVRSDINSALQAIVSVNSGTTYPATTYANMLVYRTDTHTLQKRNEANSAWITLGTVTEGTSNFDPAYTYASSADASTGTDNTKVATILRARQTVSVLLGNLITTSGATQTLSGLDLTTFRELHFYFNNISSTSVSFLTLAGVQITPSLGGAVQGIRGSGILDLVSGVGSFTTGSISGAAPTSGIATSYFGDLGITTATTSIVLGTSAGTFDNGALRVYGYR